MPAEPIRPIRPEEGPARRPDLHVAEPAVRPDDLIRWWGRPLAETRWVLELGRLMLEPALLDGKGVPHGDGRPVVLMPGLGAGDQTLLVLAGWLRRIGYRPRLCGFIANVDCSDRWLDRVERRVDALYHRYGRRVALLGHSRGAHYARALAVASPAKVSHAISLGADLQGMLGVSVPTVSAAQMVRHGIVLTGRARSPDCLTLDCPCRFMRRYVQPFPTDQVRFTSIYSKGDGVVRWERQIVPEADCVEVTGSHIGLVFNRKAYRVIADALAASELAT
jgi:triacylglycerol lipase